MPQYIKNYIVEKGQAGWVFGGFGGSVVVMGELLVGQWVVCVISFQYIWFVI